MGHLRQPLAVVAGFMVCLLAPSRAPAAPPRPPAASEPTKGSEAHSADDKTEARVHYDNGIELYTDGKWAVALAEFREARRLYPSRGAIHVAGLCLEKLGRYDEALDAFEAELREFGETMPIEAKKTAQLKVVEMRGLVGTIEIEDAEPGAAISVDGQPRGEYPLLEPLRVAAGSRIVRAYKQGFEPFETRVELSGRQTQRVAARLHALMQSGRLHIVEQKGRALEVMIDGNRVGKTPWEGQVAIGEHTVVLLGDGHLGTQPVSAAARLNHVTELKLAAEELSVLLRIEPKPLNASVAIDGVTVGRGVWEARMRPGTLRIEVAAPGFSPQSQLVNLMQDQRKLLHVTLERDKNSIFWRKPPQPSRFLVQMSSATALFPSIGSDISGACDESCQEHLGVGGLSTFQVGYELGVGFGFGLTGGYLAATQATNGRRTSVKPVGLSSDSATVNDRIGLRGGLVGGWLEYSFRERVSLHFQLGAGFFLGNILDERTGSLIASDGNNYGLGPVIERNIASFFYLSPEVQLGLPLGRHVEINAGISVPVLLGLRRPVWDSTTYIRVGTDGLGRLTPDPLAKTVLFAIAPGIGARYYF